MDSYDNFRVPVSLNTETQATIHVANELADIKEQSKKESKQNTIRFWVSIAVSGIAAIASVVAVILSLIGK